MTYAKAYGLGGTSAATNTIQKISDRASLVAKYFTFVDIFDKINMGSKRYRYTTNAIHGIMEREHDSFCSFLCRVTHTFGCCTYKNPVGRK